MRFIRALLYYWHTLKSAYYLALLDCCLNKDIKEKTTKKFDHHRAISQSIFKQRQGGMKEDKLDKYIA